MAVSLRWCTSRSISATSETYIDMGTPGLGATLSAPGMWLIAYSRNGRASSTRALLSARMCRSSSVETSAVGCPASPRTASKIVGTAWVAAAASTKIGTSLPNPRDRTRGKVFMEWPRSRNDGTGAAARGTLDTARLCSRSPVAEAPVQARRRPVYLAYPPPSGAANVIPRLETRPPDGPGPRRRLPARRATEHRQLGHGRQAELRESGERRDAGA